MSILVKNLSLDLSDRLLLKNISFELKPGEMVAVIGENGAGKTSLINCLTDCYSTHESVFINGRAIESYTLEHLAQFRAVLTQSNELTFPFKVAEVVRLGLSLTSLSVNQQDQVIEDCLRLVDGCRFKERNYQTLSGGEKQRIQLARVLAQISIECDYPRYLFLDEPTSALDMKHQFETLKMLKSLCRKNIGIVIILHDINLAAMYCDRIALLKQGELLKLGTPNEVFQRQIIKQGFEVDVDILNHPNSNTPIMINQAI
jgi:iron complex transport system ATP-binding protein